jgi:methionyl-tRNA formyltransferase
MLRPMPDEIIILTGDAEAPFLTRVLEEQNAQLRLTHVRDEAALMALAGRPDDLGGSRLIAYCTSVIVPADILNQLPGPAYNFHPGPPSYPGVYPANFAIYDGAAKFGITVHEMAENVDAGAIVATEWFDVPDDFTSPKLEEKAYILLYQVFCQLAPQLADLSQVLAPIDETWADNKSTMKDFEALSTAAASDEDRERHERAFG